MSVSKFIGASSTLLLTWLAATFFHQVPAERYPKLGRGNKSLTVAVETSEHSVIAATNPSAKEAR